MAVPRCASVCVLTALVGCSNEDAGRDCSTEVVPSVRVAVTNADAVAIVDATVTFAVGAAPEQPCTYSGYDGVYTCGTEVAGELRITVFRGTRQVSGAATVGRDECHVITENIALVMP
jgi:hypothetical protein